MITVALGLVLELGLRIVVYKPLEKVTKCGSATWLKLINGDLIRTSAQLRILLCPSSSRHKRRNILISCWRNEWWLTCGYWRTSDVWLQRQHPDRVGSHGRRHYTARHQCWKTGPGVAIAFQKPAAFWRGHVQLHRITHALHELPHSTVRSRSVHPTFRAVISLFRISWYRFDIPSLYGICTGVHARGGGMGVFPPPPMAAWQSCPQLAIL